MDIRYGEPTSRSIFLCRASQTCPICPNLSKQEQSKKEAISYHLCCSNTVLNCGSTNFSKIGWQFLSSACCSMRAQSSKNWIHCNKSGSPSAHGTVDPAWKRLILWCKNANRARTWNHLEETHLASFGGICFRELHQRSTATVPVWRGTPASWTEWGTWRHFHNPCNRSGCSNRACSATVVVMADRFPCTRGLALATRQIPLLRLMFFLPST